MRGCGGEEGGGGLGGAFERGERDRELCWAPFGKAGRDREAITGEWDRPGGDSVRGRYQVLGSRRECQTC